jgi:hypothetical protein
MRKADFSGWRLTALVAGISPLSFFAVILAIYPKKALPSWALGAYLSLLVLSGLVAAITAHKMGRRGWLWFLGCVAWGLPTVALLFVESKVVVSSLPRWRNASLAKARHDILPHASQHKAPAKAVPCDFCQKFTATMFTWYAMQEQEPGHRIYHGLGSTLALAACPHCYRKLVWRRLWHKVKREFLTIRLTAYAMLIWAFFSAVRERGLPPLEFFIALFVIPVVESIALLKKLGKVKLHEAEVAKAKAGTRGLTLRAQEGSDFFPITASFVEVNNDWVGDQRDTCAFCGEPPDVINAAKLGETMTLYLGICHPCRRKARCHHCLHLLAILGCVGLFIAGGLLAAYYVVLWQVDFQKWFVWSLVGFIGLVVMICHALPILGDPYYVVRATPEFQRYAACGYGVMDCVEVREYATF